MEINQQQLTDLIQSCNSHTAIDGAIEQLSKYVDEQRHEQRFFSKCYALILQKILTVSFNNNITAN